MRVPTTTAAGPVHALPQDLVDREFSQITWTNFSGQVTGIEPDEGAPGGYFPPGSAPDIGSAIDHAGMAADAVCGEDIVCQYENGTALWPLSAAIDASGFDELLEGVESNRGIRIAFGLSGAEDFGNCMDSPGFNWACVSTGASLLGPLGKAGKGRHALDLGSDIRRAAKSADTVVLGHYPEYVDLAKATGGRTFQVPTKVWDSMSPTEQWAANQKFLDRAIARGSDIQLATPANAAREGSFFERELQYMQSRGYTVGPDGMSLIAPGVP